MSRQRTQTSSSGGGLNDHQDPASPEVETQLDSTYTSTMDWEGGTVVSWFIQCLELTLCVPTGPDNEAQLLFQNDRNGHLLATSCWCLTFSFSGLIFGPKNWFSAENSILALFGLSAIPDASVSSWKFSWGYYSLSKLKHWYHLCKIGQTGVVQLYCVG